MHVLFFPFFSILSFPNAQKLRENQKKNEKKKNNPVRRILGKSMQNCFCFFGFSRGFFTLPSPIVQKLEENQKKQKTKTIL